MTFFPVQYVIQTFPLRKSHYLWLSDIFPSLHFQWSTFSRSVYSMSFCFSQETNSTLFSAYYYSFLFGSCWASGLGFLGLTEPERRWPCLICTSSNSDTHSSLCPLAHAFQNSVNAGEAGSVRRQLAPTEPHQIVQL